MSPLPLSGPDSTSWFADRDFQVTMVRTLGWAHADGSSLRVTIRSNVGNSREFHFLATMVFEPSDPIEGVMTQIQAQLTQVLGPGFSGRVRLDLASSLDPGNRYGSLTRTLVSAERPEPASFCAEEDGS